MSTPGWRDGRLLLGVLLVLVSVLVGARVLATADSSQQVWVVTRDLAAGAVLEPADLTMGKARLYGASGRYLAGPKPVGYVVLRALGRDELLPGDALDRPGARQPRRDVTVPVEASHLPPDLARGDQVDIYVTPDAQGVRRAAEPAVGSAPRLVLSGVLVAKVPRAGGLAAGGQEQPVVLSVDPAQVLPLIQALAVGRIDLVRVPYGVLGPLVATVERS